MGGGSHLLPPAQSDDVGSADGPPESLVSRLDVGGGPQEHEFLCYAQSSNAIVEQHLYGGNHDS